MRSRAGSCGKSSAARNARRSSRCRRPAPARRARRARARRCAAGWRAAPVRARSRGRRSGRSGTCRRGAACASARRITSLALASGAPSIDDEVSSTNTSSRGAICGGVGRGGRLGEEEELARRRPAARCASTASGAARARDLVAQDEVLVRDRVARRRASPRARRRIAIWCEASRALDRDARVELDRGRDVVRRAQARRQHRRRLRPGVTATLPSRPPCSRAGCSAARRPSGTPARSRRPRRRGAGRSAASPRSSPPARGSRPTA